MKRTRKARLHINCKGKKKKRHGKAYFLPSRGIGHHFFVLVSTRVKKNRQILTGFDDFVLWSIDMNAISPGLCYHWKSRSFHA